MPETVPSHVGIIPDGTRRFAKTQGLDYKSAYTLGAEKVTEAVKWCFSSGVNEVSIFGLSYDNVLNRGDEVDAILDVQRAEFESWLKDSFFAENGVRIVFAGDLSLLPENFRATCKSLSDKTRGNSSKRLNVLLAYAGGLEALAAARTLLGKLAPTNGSKITQEELAAALQVPSNVDLVIRTGKRKRLSGFLPLQSQYAEIYFSNKLWPEFAKTDLDAAIREWAVAVKTHGS